MGIWIWFVRLCWEFEILTNSMEMVDEAVVEYGAGTLQYQGEK
jgi:hypothetical protein